MEKLLVFTFWAGIFTVFYTYIGYAIVIYILFKLKKTRSVYADLPNEALPMVTLVVAAYNEEAFIAEKIKNTLALNYPSEKLKLLFVTDGSSDKTPDIIREFPQVQVFHENIRKGKIHAVNRVMRYVTTPITVFCDANTYLNPMAIRNLVRHYQDEKTGGVAGEKRIFKKEADNASGSGEGLYWKYESFLKEKDAAVYSIVGAAGELFSIRTSLFEPPEENMIIEDFYMSLRVVARGYRFAYEPEAYAMETASASVDEEWKRKVRICAGGFQAMNKLTCLLNPFRYGILSFQYFSHRVLRWTLAPLFLPLIFIANLVLASEGSPFYQFTMLMQVLFYLAAFAGHLLQHKTTALKFFFVPCYFAIMNAAVYAGFFRYLRGKQSVVWERAKRAEVIP